MCVAALESKIAKLTEADDGKAKVRHVPHPPKAKPR